MEQNLSQGHERWVGGSQLPRPECRRSTGLQNACSERSKKGGRANIVQSSLAKEWWIKAAPHYCFSANIAITNGDSPYNRRHKKGHFAGLQIPFGVEVTLLLQPHSVEQQHSFESKGIFVIFLSWHLLPGGVWSGDYLVAEALGDQGFQANINANTHEGKIHRIKEVMKPTSCVFPVPTWRNDITKIPHELMPSIDAFR